MSWTVASVMTTDVVTMAPGATYKEIVERLHGRLGQGEGPERGRPDDLAGGDRDV
jgi:hypothetical protein